MTKRELMDNIGNEEGTVEEAEQWLAELQAIDPYFWQSDMMSQLAESVQRRRRAQTILSQMSNPPSAAEIAALLDSIDYSKAESGEDIAELDARDHVKLSIFPHPDTLRYLKKLRSDDELSTEAAVQAALVYQPKATFHMPGPIDTNWHPSKE